MLTSKGRLFAIAVTLLCGFAAHGMSVVVATSADSPAPVGTMITFSAAVSTRPVPISGTVSASGEWGRIGWCATTVR